MGGAIEGRRLEGQLVRRKKNERAGVAVGHQIPNMNGNSARNSVDHGLNVIHFKMVYIPSGYNPY